MPPAASRWSAWSASVRPTWWVEGWAVGGGQVGHNTPVPRASRTDCTPCKPLALHYLCSSPQLHNPESRAALQALGFKYDASIIESWPSVTSPSSAERLYPYSMSAGIPQTCQVRVGRRPLVEGGEAAASGGCHHRLGQAALNLPHLQLARASAADLPPPNSLSPPPSSAVDGAFHLQQHRAVQPVRGAHAAVRVTKRHRPVVHGAFWVGGSRGVAKGMLRCNDAGRLVLDHPHSRALSPSLPHSRRTPPLTLPRR